MNTYIILFFIDNNIEIVLCAGCSRICMRSVPYTP